jgi:hypothetical protein
MGRYTSFVGKRVEVDYRSVDVHFFAVGVLVSDTEKSICLEDRFSSGGKDKTIRFEIPYTYVIRVVEVHSTNQGSAVPVLRTV